MASNRAEARNKTLNTLAANLADAHEDSYPPAQAIGVALLAAVSIATVLRDIVDELEVIAAAFEVDDA